MIDLLYVPPVSIALFRGHAEREPPAGVFRSKSASFRQFQWRGESLGEARSAVGFVGNSPPVRDSGLTKNRHRRYKNGRPLPIALRFLFNLPYGRV